MEDINILQILDKVKKNLERGAVPVAISEIDATITLLNRKIALGKGFRFAELHITQDTVNASVRGDKPISQEDETRYKVNEIIRFLNERFPVQ